MIAFAKIAVLLLVAIIAMALTAEARELLDYYDDCYNRKFSSQIYSLLVILGHAVCNLCDFDHRLTGSSTVIDYLSSRSLSPSLALLGA